MEQNEMKNISIPENAYRELKAGEEYKPVMGAQTTPAEVTPYSVTMGVVMAIIFSAAAAFLGLKVGQVFEAAIPIAIIAVGVGTALGKKNMLGQNIIIQSIGASSGVIVAGAIFTLPALYILGLDVNFFQIFLSSLLGGILGIILLIPFRKYFVKEMHGKYPFPEATATSEVLISGEKGGSQAKLLGIAGLIGGVYNFAVGTFGAWAEVVSTRVSHFGAMMADKFKTEFSISTDATILGLGYIIGLKYAVIITAGSCLVWFLIVPLVGFVMPDDVAAGVTADTLFKDYGRPIGIGGIAMAGLIGILRQAGIIKQALGLAVSEFSKKSSSAVAVERTQRDLSMKLILTILCATLLTTLVFFHFGLLGSLWQSVVALLIVFVISFLFTTVAANAIAIVGSNPVSGMTLMTLILSSLVLVSIGLTGNSGMTAALIIGGVVCTALSMAGGFITDLKIGYWLGTTPRKQEAWKFLGTIVSAATVAGVMLILNKTYGFTDSSSLAAPQANAMAAVIEPLMTGGDTPWILYIMGAVLALVLQAIGVPALPFSLGMFIPMSLNAPLVVGGLVAWFVSNRSKDEALNKARFDRGTLIASGFIAGGALMGVLTATLKFMNVQWEMTAWKESDGAQYVALAMYVVLIAYMTIHTLRAKK
ncbi:MAG: oligopeptide transporter, OPT family [Rikenellaceae bacterium]|nr:oligopeptide transporter, OPT family [Rikenellaceae bacterium]MBQ3203784.1 oligopeptide transporter, OPT family [Alistipes sp.]MBR2014369.1 oligopeptide transporter, OPT family [Alistipes sp.]